MIVQIAPDSDFPIENIPFGVISTAADQTPRIATAIGDHALDLSKIAHLFNGPILSSKSKVFTEVKKVYDKIENSKFFYGLGTSSMERG